MKIASEIALQASPDRIWNTLLDFTAYPEWNRVVKAVRGRAEPDSLLEIDFQFYGEKAAGKTARVTGLIPPKYLSWTWNHSLGAWFLAAEHVFRIRQKEDGRVVFHQEMYYTGLSIRFGRKAAQQMVRMTLEKFNDDLKDRVEAGSG